LRYVNNCGIDVEDYVRTVEITDILSVFILMKRNIAVKAA
jgi:hypothetical protein